MEKRVLALIEKARAVKLMVTHAVIMSFGRAAKKSLLGADTTSSADKAKLEGFRVGEKWCRNFVKRHELKSKRLHGEAGSVNPEVIAKGMAAIRLECTNYKLENIINCDETDLFYKLLPKTTYLTPSEDRKTARGTKYMKAKDRVSAIMCTNAPGTFKVPMTIIGKSKNPRCFRRRDPPLKYLSQANAWSDTATFRRWWHEALLPAVRRWTHEPVLLLMANCWKHDELVDDREQVKVMTYPRKCKSKHQPMGAGIIEQTKVGYRAKLLDYRISTMLVASQLRAEARERNMPAGSAGLAGGFQPHILDAADILKQAWDEVSAEQIAR